jgi:hypothetical protein
MNLQRQEAFDDGAENNAVRQTSNDQSRNKKSNSLSSSTDNNNKNRRERAGSVGNMEDMEPRTDVGKGKQTKSDEKETQAGMSKSRAERQGTAVEQFRSRSSSRGRLSSSRNGESLSSFDALTGQASTTRGGRGSLTALGQSMMFESDLSKDKLQSPRMTSASSVVSSDSAPVRRTSSVRRRRDGGASVNSGTSSTSNAGGDSGTTVHPPRRQGSYTRATTPASDAGPRERQARRNSGKNLQDANETSAGKNRAKLDTTTEATTGSSSHRRRLESVASSAQKGTKDQLIAERHLPQHLQVTPKYRWVIDVRRLQLSRRTQL